MMKALVRKDGNVAVCEVPMPEIRHADDVLIRIEKAAICRTDIYVARGKLASADSLILGHEFAGVVVRAGSNAPGFNAGDRVSGMPIVPCGHCEECRTHNEIVCQESRMLGVDRDGAFAQYVVLPARLLAHLPDHVSFEEGAYAEPVAASLGAVTAGLRTVQRGVILGKNRIALLAERTLRAIGFTQLDVLEIDEINPSMNNRYDFAIETVANEKVIEAAVTLVRPRGTIVLKSRQFTPVPLHFIPIVKKELNLRAVHYAPFMQAIELISAKRIELADLIGPAAPLEDFEAVFAQADSSEKAKLYFDPWR